MFKRLAFLLLFSFILTGCVLDEKKSSTPPTQDINPPRSLISGDIYVSLNFQYLPNTIQVNHPSTDSFHTEFYLEINFDINGNETQDEGDIWFDIWHTKRPETEPKEVNTSDLEARASVINEVSDEPAFFVKELSSINYRVENNRLDFIVNKNSHPELLDITNYTGIRVTAYFREVDGQGQWDSFPDNGYTPQGIDLANMLDNSDDVYTSSSEPIIVDIEEISIQFIE